MFQTKLLIGNPGDKYEQEKESENTIIQGGGQPLRAPERAFFEPRFGYDFGKVRIHNDGQAAATARGLNARALTLGSDVVFGQNQYAPQSRACRRLLAHELTHVVQQMAQRVSQGTRSVRRLCQIPHPMVQRDGPEKDKTALEKLDELLNQYWPSDANILAHLRELNHSEKNTVITGDEYRRKLVSHLSDETMFDALEILGPECPTRVDWLKAKGVKLDYLWLDKGFLESTDGGCSLDKELKKRIFNLCDCLNALRLLEHKPFPATSGCRTNKRAHQLSTGYHIFADFITLKDLQSYLPQGPGDIGNEVLDNDGNLWYVRDWTLTETKANAKKIYTDRDKGDGDPLIPLAYEGYEVGDPRRNPNTDNPTMPMVSSHVYGQAIDLSRRRMPWKKDPWDAEHEKIINSYELVRPVNSSGPYGPAAAEFWHYEKKMKGSPGQKPAPAPGPGSEPEPEKPALPQQMITSIANVRLIRDDPSHWNDEAYILARLPEGTRVEVLDRGAGESFNQTAQEYQWWQVRVDGVEGWVMQVLLDPITDHP